MEFEIGVGVLLVLALLQCALLLRLWRRSGRLERRFDSLAANLLRAIQTDVPTSMLVTVLGRMEQRIALPGQQPAPAAAVSYELAQQLAREGVDIEQMIVRCGLTRDEARLIRQLHPAGG